MSDDYTSGKTDVNQGGGSWNFTTGSSAWVGAMHTETARAVQASNESFANHQAAMTRSNSGPANTSYSPAIPSYNYRGNAYAGGSREARSQAVGVRPSSEQRHFPPPEPQFDRPIPTGPQRYVVNVETAKLLSGRFTELPSNEELELERTVKALEVEYDLESSTLTHAFDTARRLSSEAIELSLEAYISGKPLFDLMQRDIEQIRERNSRINESNARTFEANVETARLIKETSKKLEDLTLARHSLQDLGDARRKRESNAHPEAQELGFGSIVTATRPHTNCWLDVQTEVLGKEKIDPKLQLNGQISAWHVAPIFNLDENGRKFSFLEFFGIGSKFRILNYGKKHHVVQPTYLMSQTGTNGSWIFVPQGTEVMEIGTRHKCGHLHVTARNAEGEWAAEGYLHPSLVSAEPVAPNSGKNIFPIISPIMRVSPKV